MHNKPKIYLAGPISGLAYSGAQDWRDNVSNALWKVGLIGYSPLRAKGYLRSAGVIEQSYENHPLSTDRGITSRDRWDVMTCDAVLFNLLGATKRVSVGTCIEFGWADAFRKPIIVVMEPNLQNVHDHPMTREVTNFRVETLDEAVVLLDRIFNPQLHFRSTDRGNVEYSL
jgi:nucleoside 2-deoxyribosyltransferase